MAAIRPCTGTTADWKAVEDTLILKEREIGVEIDTSGHYQIRQGYMNPVNNFSKNMTEATNSANGAATTANNAASTASAAAKACQGIVNGLNTMVDTVTKKSCVLTVEDGILTIREA